MFPCQRGFCERYHFHLWRTRSIRTDFCVFFFFFTSESYSLSEGSLRTLKYLKNPFFPPLPQPSGFSYQNIFDFVFFSRNISSGNFLVFRTRTIPKTLLQRNSCFMVYLLHFIKALEEASPEEKSLYLARLKPWLSFLLCYCLRRWSPRKNPDVWWNESDSTQLTETEDVSEVLKWNLDRLPNQYISEARDGWVEAAHIEHQRFILTHSC